MRKNRRKAYWHPKKKGRRYQCMLLHKDEMKRSHAREWNCSSWNSLVKEAEAPEYIRRTVSPLAYWKHYYKDSSEKRYAKRVTNRAIRRHVRMKVRTMADFEAAPKCMHGAQYQRFFDYAWYIS